MMKSILALATALMFVAGPAFANSCPKHMAAIDAALAKNPPLAAEQMAQVKKLRAEGEQLHNAGQHQQSMDALSKAETILGINK